MSTLRFRRAALAVTAAAVLPLALSACSNDMDGKDKDKASDKASSSEAKPSKDSAGGGMDAMAKPFGPACATVPKGGKGSFDGMAKDPVATAASHNPALSTLVTAVKKAGLVDTLNGAKDITVFAPTNDAFGKIPKAQLDKVLADKTMLTKILTGHVVGEKISPDKLADGSFDTLAKNKLTTSGSGESYMVDGSANVVCGNVQTANATVHIIDTVLLPKK
ncbi:lipoprotein [Streptomyces kronopolitis]|uniref:Lipoprotein n=1 Tax=Streptomyces kronopolitis TaxID=1612435 RepID=A0ABQ2J540_9ACTN|nr:fasciclin domain-containing protein [Streptomyces kronopolitis]MCL6297840.1 fasciclin domain-containing protein [Streptomyces kronopolitis]GGN40337.1 lipoprotein [Streptomyces kronopolitis]